MFESPYFIRLHFVIALCTLSLVFVFSVRCYWLHVIGCSLNRLSRSRVCVSTLFLASTLCVPFSGSRASRVPLELFRYSHLFFCISCSICRVCGIYSLFARKKMILILSYFVWLQISDKIKTFLLDLVQQLCNNDNRI